MVKVKICGITNVEDAMAAADAGADLLGFVFYEKSPRNVLPEQAQEIAAALRRSSCRPKLVGVFVNQAPERMEHIIRSVPLDLVQLHGNESIHTLLSLSIRGYKALRPREHVELWEQVEHFRPVLYGNVPAFIVDGYDPTRYGGTGVCGDWNVAASVAREFPILLAGGLNCENVASAIRQVRPWGVDVSTGVERAPGVKDHDRVRQFICDAKRVGLDTE